MYVNWPMSFYGHRNWFGGESVIIKSGTFFWRNRLSFFLWMLLGKHIALVVGRHSVTMRGNWC